MDNFNLKKYLSESKLTEEGEKSNKIFVMKSPFAPKGQKWDHIGFVLNDGKLRDMSGHRGSDTAPETYEYEDTEELFQMPQSKEEAIEKGLYSEKELPKEITIPNNVACDIKDPNKKAENCGSFVKIVLSNNDIETTKSNWMGDIFNSILENKGLWHNIRAKRARGEKPSSKGSKAYKDAVKAGKKINTEENIDEIVRESDFKEFAKYLREISIPENIQEAKYQGRTVTLNKPMRGDSKKFKVYVNSGKKNADGTIKVKKVEFGAKGMNIKKNNPKRRKAFRARHNCSNPGPKTKARYWSCRKW